jgi:hypothetical protein
MKAPELKSGQMITIAYLIGIVLVLFIVYKILGAVGLITTAAKKREKKNENAAISDIRAEEYFDPMFLKTADKKGYTAMGSAGEQYAKDIHDSIYGFMKAGTDAEKIFVTFSRLKCKYNVSEVSLNYLVKYNRNMQADLLNNLNNAHIVELNNIIDKLPIKK